MIKHILINLLFAELLYLLIKPLIIKLESEDDIDTAPADYALNGDQADLDIAFRENKASNVSKPPHLEIKWTKE